MSSKTSSKSTLATATPMIREISALCDQMIIDLRATTGGALHIGLRLLVLHRDTGDQITPGGFKAALAAISDRVPRSTAYRWINAASNVLAAHQGITDERGDYDPGDLKLAAPDTPGWTKLEKVLTDRAQGTSLRRLLLGSAEKSEESRFDDLMNRDEAGDKNATALLEEIAAGKLTLVQAIRALGGMGQKEKTRTDPVYLDLDGRTGQPRGLFPKSLITISNTFARWDSLDQPARKAVKAAWKECVSKLPKELQ